MANLSGFTVFLDVSGASAGTIDKIVQAISASSSMEKINGAAQFFAAATEELGKSGAPV